MIKKTVPFLAKLAFALIVTFSVSGWVPFTAPVTIHSEPEGATVTDTSTGLVLGTTPVNTRVFLREKPLHISKSGYFSEEVVIDYHTARDIRLKLRRLFPVVVSSQPEKAQVCSPETGEVIGRTPFPVDTSDKSTDLTLKLDGYHDETLALERYQEDNVQVDFKRLPTIILSSTPEGASVLENGKLIGKTPLTTKAVNNRNLEITQVGYFDKNITVSYNTPPRMSVELEKLPVILLTATPKAKIYRNGKYIGETPVKLAVKKSATLTLKANRHYEKTVQLNPRAAKNINATLQAMPYVKVTSVPKKAKVYRDGKPLGTTPLELLAEKSMNLELRKDGYETATKQISKGSRKTVKVELIEIPVVVEIPETNIVEEVTVAEKIAEPEEEEEEEGINPMVWVVAAAILFVIIVAIPLLKKKS